VTTAAILTITIILALAVLLTSPGPPRFRK
jgi:hypothetical protein